MECSHRIVRLNEDVLVPDSLYLGYDRGAVSTLPDGYYAQLTIGVVKTSHQKVVFLN